MEKKTEMSLEMENVSNNAFTTLLFSPLLAIFLSDHSLTRYKKQSSLRSFISNESWETSLHGENGLIFG